MRMRLHDAPGRRSSSSIRAVTSKEARQFAESVVPLSGPPPGTLVGDCLPLDSGDDHTSHECQRSDQLDASDAGILITFSDAGLGAEDIEVLDTTLEDWREPASPLLGPLVRRWYAKTELGWRGITGLAAPPQGAYVFDPALPPKPVLRFSLGYEPGTHAAPEQFRVLQDGRVLLSEVIPSDHLFHDFELPLTEVRGTTHLELEARPTTAIGNARGLWLDPRA